MKYRVSNLPLLVFFTAVAIFCIGVSYYWIQQYVSVNESGGEDQKRTVLSIQPDDYVYGDRNATVILFEYADTECPFCKKLYFKIETIVAEYKEKGVALAIVYRHAPLGIWDKSVTEAHAAECVGRGQGERGYYAFLERLYETTPSDDGFDVALLPGLARSVGADATAFTACMDRREYLNKIKEQKLSSAALGVRTVPHLFIVGKKNIYEVVGNKPKDTITFLIEQALHEE